MNAVEIEEAVSALAERPFDAAEFPYAFLMAFGNKEATIKRLRAGASNKSDLGGVLQVNHVHLKAAAPGDVRATLDALRASDATQNKRNKVRYILATDGDMFEAEDLETGETVACAYKDFPDHFGFFLTLAGITTVKQIRESSFDIRATGRLNKLYVELLKDNPEWATAARRPDMNHFMARLIFCFFAEDTDIFNGTGLFTATIAQMTERDSSNTHTAISEIFRAMNTKIADREAAKLPRWADAFPYVNGGLFSGSTETPRFSKMARSYLLHIGSLNWKQINPDIFGSMIQAVADDEERGALGMHYTSVPNILKVLNPLFLDDLREKLEEAGTNKRKLQNLRKRMARIRVFDPACGSGNFLVIAYKQMREIERRIVVRLNDGADTVEALLDTASWAGERSVIPLTNFRGIELRDFPAEIARLALIIAEYQCDVLYRGQKEALVEFLPLDAQNWITCGNALRLDWLSICPPTGTGVKLHADDMLGTPLDQTEIDFENQGGETYVCGNPQFKGARKQSASQKEDLEILFDGHNDFKDCDYVVGWYLKSAEYIASSRGRFALVATNSIAQGEQVAHLWSRLFKAGLTIEFAHRTFLWRNNAADNAGVHCVVVGVTAIGGRQKKLFEADTVRHVNSISPYLTPGDAKFIEAAASPISMGLPPMVSGNMARDGGNLFLSTEDAEQLLANFPASRQFLKRAAGTKEINQGVPRYCLWIEDAQLGEALTIDKIRDRVKLVEQMRASSSAKTTRTYASIPHKFAQRCHRNEPAVAIPKTTTGLSAYLTPNVYDGDTVVTDLAFVSYPMSLVSFAVLSSMLHLVWAKTVAGGMRDGLRYSSQLAYHTFPLPRLSEKNQTDLTRCAEEILLTREAHFPATIADLYDPENMPADLREAHERNDEVLERIYIGRRFRNDTERLEKLFELYTKMTTGKSAATTAKGHKNRELGDEDDGSTQQVD